MEKDLELVFKECHFVRIQQWMIYIIQEGLAILFAELCVLRDVADVFTVKEGNWSFIE